MSVPSSKDSEEEKDEDDAWHQFSNAGYSSASIELDEIEPQNNPSEVEEWFDGDDFQFEGKIIDWNAPPCPTPLGISHIIKIGTCDYCLQRVSGKNMPGEEIRTEAYDRDNTLESSFDNNICPLCENLFDDVNNIVDRIVEQVSNLEYSTIQIGMHLPKDLIQDEDQIRIRHGATGSRPLKSAMVDSIQNEISKNLDSEIKFVKEKPDLMILIDGLTLRVDIDIRPIFFYGRYRKLSREIPQTRWPCRSCRGRAKGCESCNESGLQYLDSVQDLIGEPIRLALDAEDCSFHGMGREDINVRCLGNGRPFIMEIKKPMSRIPDLEELVKQINTHAKSMVEIDDIRRAERSEISKIKASRSEKSYAIRFTVSEDIDEKETLESISNLSGIILNQETPQRVSHRRAAKIRKRKIVNISNIIIEGNEIQFDIRAEAGTYIKEFIHSDSGRTIPSVSETLGSDCNILWLDVLAIHDDEENQVT